MPTSEPFIKINLLMIAIINYGLGNLNSISNMMKKIGANASVISSPDCLHDVSKIILPGVGAFNYGMDGLMNGGWVEPLNKYIFGNGIPVLGICLGMQLMCNYSEEGNIPGLSWINASVKKFVFDSNSNLKIPHMGWNTIKIKNENSLLKTDEEQRYYFVHSYYVECNDGSDTIAVSNHGFDFTAAFGKRNIYGVQFHPEKSHKYGMVVLKNFIEL
jgi:glutamine amidotransferase